MTRDSYLMVSCLLSVTSQSVVLQFPALHLHSNGQLLYIRCLHICLKAQMDLWTRQIIIHTSPAPPALNHLVRAFWPKSIKVFLGHLNNSYLPWWHPPLHVPGWWAVGFLHCTATMSSEGTCGLYGLRLMHRLNIFLSCFGPRAGQAIIFLSLFCSNPNLNVIIK